MVRHTALRGAILHCIPSALLDIDMVTSCHHAIVCCESKMNAVTFTAMLTAMRSDRKIEAIRLLREMITDHCEAFSDSTESRFQFARDFIEALQPELSNQSADELPHYRFGVAYRSFGGDHEYNSHLSEFEATRQAAEILAGPEFDVDYVYVVEIKQSAVASTTYNMKPFIS